MVIVRVTWPKKVRGTCKVMDVETHCCGRDFREKEAVSVSRIYAHKHTRNYALKSARGHSTLRRHARTFRDASALRPGLLTRCAAQRRKIDAVVDAEKRCERAAT